MDPSSLVGENQEVIARPLTPLENASGGMVDAFRKPC